MLRSNVLITGIPRGGTTLLTAMLDSFPGWICLSEPYWQTKWTKDAKDGSSLAQRIIDDYVVTRRKIIAGLPLPDRRSANGKAITNYYVRAVHGEVHHQGHLNSIRFQVKDANFTLGMKHNALYTALLPSLVKKRDYSIVSIVRHPVPTILSWRSLRLPISRGRLPAGEKFWPELDQLTSSRQSLLKKQVAIYELFCKRYMEFLDHIHLLKYEQLIREPSLLEQWTGTGWNGQVAIKDGNRNKYHDIQLSQQIWQLIERYAPFTQQLYSFEEWNEQSRTSN